MYVDIKCTIWTRSELTDSEGAKIKMLLENSNGKVTEDVYEIINRNTWDIWEDSIEPINTDINDGVVLELFDEDHDVIATGYELTNTKPNQRYVLAMFPDSQLFMDHDRFDECIAVSGEDILDNSYMIPEDLYNLIIKN